MLRLPINPDGAIITQLAKWRCRTDKAQEGRGRSPGGHGSTAAAQYIGDTGRRDVYVDHVGPQHELHRPLSWTGEEQGLQNAFQYPRMNRRDSQPRFRRGRTI